MDIYNVRNYFEDEVSLLSGDWSGLLVGSDGYPMKDECGRYFIGGGSNKFLKAKAIEFYGVKTRSD